jgi:hypothetical protein
LLSMHNHRDVVRTSLSKASLSLLADHLKLTDKPRRVESAGPRPIWSETFSKHLRTLEPENAVDFCVTLPAVWLVLVEHIIKRGKLVVSLT